MVDWKKEIKLSDLTRRGRETPPEEVESTPKETVEKTSIWKREISFGRKKRPQPDPPASDTAEAPDEPTLALPAAEPVPAAPDPVQRILQATASPSAFGEEDEGALPASAPEAPLEAALPDAPQYEPEPAPEQPLPPAAGPAPAAPTQPHVELAALPAQPPAEVAAPPAQAWPEPATVPAEPTFELPAHPAPELAAVPAEPTFELPAQPAAELAVPPAQASPELAAVPAQPTFEPPAQPTFAPPAPPPPPLPGVHPPVPASELPPLPEEQEEEKADRKRGRRRKKGDDGEGGAKVPFYKRELSFGRKKSKADADDPAPETTKEKAERVPFYKRELSLRRNAKADEPKEPKAPRAAPKLAFPKLALPKLSLPARASGGAAAVAGRQKRLVGLKIGASQLAAARVVNNGHAELVQAAREPLERGIIVAGELRDPDALSESLKAFFRKHKLPRRGIRLGIANNRIGVRILDISGIDDPKQLANAIRFRAGEALPIPIEEAVLDYQLLSHSVDEEGVSTHRVLLVVAYRELIDRYVNACRKAGLRLVGIDLEAFALLRALGAPRPEVDVADAALVVVSIGHDRSTFAVSDGRICEFTRVLDWGGQALDVAVARTLDVTPSAAEPVKHELSLLDDAVVPEELSAEQAAEAREAVRRQLQVFARELVSSLQFYQSQPGSLGIGELVLTGGTTHLPGLAEELERLIGVSVRVGDPLIRVRLAKRLKQEPEQLGSLAVAIGLGIED